MTLPPPPAPELSSLLHAKTARERERAWSSFLDAYSRLFLHVARAVARDHDDAMDAYTHVLEQLRSDDCARLRAYAADGRTKFSTWLVVVTRRLCLDHHRLRYGRARESQSDSASREQAFRRRLQDLAGEPIENTEVPAASPNGEDLTRAAELSELLDAALKTLNGDDRLLLKLRFEDELSAQEIADLLHLATPFHVYRRIEAVVSAVRRELIRSGVESPIP